MFILFNAGKVFSTKFRGLSTIIFNPILIYRVNHLEEGALILINHAIIYQWKWNLYCILWFAKLTCCLHCAISFSLIPCVVQQNNVHIWLSSMFPHHHHQYACTGLWDCSISYGVQKLFPYFIKPSKAVSRKWRVKEPCRLNTEVVILQRPVTWHTTCSSGF
jgi:hypothetical protein